MAPTEGLPRTVVQTRVYRRRLVKTDGEEDDEKIDVTLLEMLDTFDEKGDPRRSSRVGMEFENGNENEGVG